MAVQYTERNMSNLLALAGSCILARTLHELGTIIVFSLVGQPTEALAHECLRLGIRFIGFHNNISASRAATAYGVLTGRPGVCLLVGGSASLTQIAKVSFIGHCAHRESERGVS
jgi:2-hydroxyacyl-CoA lyase 1